MPCVLYNLESRFDEEGKHLVLGSLCSIISNCPICPRMRGSKHTLVDISLGVVGRLVELVSNGILGSGGTAAQGSIGILGDLLVGLLGGGGTGTLYALRDVVGSVLFGVQLVEDLRRWMDNAWRLGNNTRA